MKRDSMVSPHSSWRFSVIVSPFVLLSVRYLPGCFLTEPVVERMSSSRGVMVSLKKYDCVEHTFFRERVGKVFNNK